MRSRGLHRHDGLLVQLELPGIHAHSGTSGISKGDRKEGNEVARFGNHCLARTCRPRHHAGDPNRPRHRRNELAGFHHNGSGGAVL